MLQKKPEGVGSGGRVKSYAPLWELGRGGFLNVSFPRISEFLLWRKPSLTFYFLSWCESVASGQVQQVSSRWGWFWGLRSPWLHAGMEVSVSWALQRLVNVDYTTFTRRQDVLSTFFVFFGHLWLCVVGKRTKSVLPCFLPVEDSSGERLISLCLGKQKWT